MSVLRKCKGVVKMWRNRNAIRRFLEYCALTDVSFSGSVLPGELEFLKELVIRSNSLSGEIIEVGTLFGFTTQHLAIWKKSDKTLTTIDNFSWNPIGIPDHAHRALTTRSLHY